MERKVSLLSEKIYLNKNDISKFIVQAMHLLYWYSKNPLTLIVTDDDRGNRNCTFGDIEKNNKI